MSKKYEIDFFELDSENKNAVSKEKKVNITDEIIILSALIVFAVMSFFGFMFVNKYNVKNQNNNNSAIYQYSVRETPVYVKEDSSGNYTYEIEPENVKDKYVINKKIILIQNELKNKKKLLNEK